MLILLFSLFTIVFALLICKKLLGSFWFFSISLFSLLTYVIFVFVGVTLVASGIYDIRRFLVMSHISDIVILKAYFAVWISFILMLLGIFVSNLLFRSKPRIEINKFVTKKIKPIISRLDSYISPYLYFFLLVDVLIILFYWRVMIANGLTHPLICLLRGGCDLDSLKVVFYSLLPKRHYLICGEMISGFIFLISLGYALKFKNLKWRALALLTFFWSIFATFSTGIKGHLIEYFAIIFIFYYLIKGKNDFKSIFKTSMAVLIMLMIIVYAFYGPLGKDLGIREIVNYVGERVFIVQSYGVYLIFDYFPDKHEFLFGRGLSNPGSIFPYEYINPSAEIVRAYLPDLYLTKMTTMNSSISSDAYANFGWLGVFVFLFLAGFIVRTLDLIFVKYSKKTILILALYSFLIVNIGFGVAGGLNEFLQWGNVAFYALIAITIFIILGGKFLRETLKCVSVNYRKKII